MIIYLVFFIKILRTKTSLNVIIGVAAKDVYKRKEYCVKHTDAFFYYCSRFLALISKNEKLILRNADYMQTDGNNITFNISDKISELS